MFHHILNKRLNDFLKLCEEIESIDTLINSHLRLLKDIYFTIGIKERDLIINLNQLDKLVDHYKIIVSSFYNIISQNEDEFEQYKSLQEHSLDVLDFSNSLENTKSSLDKIINDLIEKNIKAN